MHFISSSNLQVVTAVPQEEHEPLFPPHVVHVEVVGAGGIFLYFFD
jgi:hypothetical protein